MAGRSFEFTITSTVNDIDSTSDSTLVFTVSFAELDLTPKYYHVSTNETVGIETEYDLSNQTVNANATNSTVELTEANFYEFMYDWYRVKKEYSPQAKPLIPSLESISSTGELTINFNKEMLVPDQLLASVENGSQLA